ncbi:MAG: biopolymer transporter ExbD [Leptolyngbyaceae cyanobacterium bins.302]|nr:biopolymer transporter ExbD [Leptolyngbyaceae cyanobacterium bins.302]
MRLPEEPDEPLQINIVPMIDVIFAILTFFIMSSLFLGRSTGLSVSLPTAKTAQNQPTSQVAVTLKSDGQLSLDKQPVALKQLQPRLRALVGTQPTLVLIQADKRVEHGSVVAVMDQLRQMPNVRMAIAAQP